MAGSVAALTAADAGSAVVLITKTDAMVSGNTHHAQGGIVFRGAGDSPEKLKADILAAGAGHCYEPAVDLFCREGPDLVQKLLIDRLEVPFAHTSKGDEYHRTSEAAHSVPRILHAKDQTGQALERAIIDVTAKHPRITSLSGRTAIDLLTTSHHSANLQDTYRLPRCFGALFFNQATGKVEPVFARQTILATGGIGRLYLHTTNPVEARGDGIAMAWRAGARCVNLHYIQFHPTALYHESGRFLISEAVRGEGGILVDGDGREFMNRFHPDGNLAPRDVVARGIHQTMIEQKITSVYLDITHKSSKWIKDRFPAIYARCQSIGLDMAREPIPVVPAAHFSCGGVAVDLDGQTSIADLFAVGEVSCTGLHGANRLASTALLECLVWGRQAGQAAAQAGQAKSREPFPDIRPWEYQQEDIDQALISQDWETIRHIMWNYVGLVRTPKRMQRARTMLRQLQMEVEEFYKAAVLSDDMIGLRNGVQTALAILFAASEAQESRGCHYVTGDG
ncbi:MAG: L-aspartate oxidase [Candidatus Marinimicrobia bacterium]|nr:L-aspartate oxidase [Candidatus Neomarinimicrobiota bacterium]